MNKNLLMVVGTVTLIGAGVMSSTPAYAQDASGQNPFQTLVQQLADKFGLKKDDVQAVFDAHRDEMKADREKRQEDRLSTLVSEGKITESQKALILQKTKELQAKKESFQNLSRDEIRTKMQKERADLEKWAKDNNIDLQYVLGPFGHGFHMGFRMGMKN